MNKATVFFMNFYQVLLTYSLSYSLTHLLIYSFLLGKKFKLDVVKLLLTHGADVTRVNARGKSPLMLAPMLANLPNVFK